MSLSADRLTRLLEKSRAGSVAAVAKAPTRPAAVPLSFSQERLWLLDRLEPGSTAYNLPFPARLVGRLDRALLERALGEIVRRHDTLRTTFALGEDGPVQRVAPAAPFTLPVVDLSHLGEDERRARVDRWLDDEAATPFDLERGPLYRARLLRLGPELHVLSQNMHHVISDGWSIGVFFRELAALLEAGGDPAALPPLPLQYPDFALQQRRRLTGQPLEAQLAYWRRQLGGEVPALELPTDRPRPNFQSHHGARLPGRLRASTTAALRELAAARGGSLFMVLLAAFKLLLHRLSGQDDVLVGSPIAGRQRLEIEGLIGFFLNTLVLRTQVDGELSFAAFLERVRDTVLGAFEHQELPFEKLLAELQPERHLSRSPFFQVLFNLINLPIYRFELPGLEVEALHGRRAESKFDLTLYLMEDDGGLRFDLVYSTDLFDEPRMAEMLAQYRGLLEQIAADPERPLGSYSLITEHARTCLPRPTARLSDAWRGSVGELFGEHATHCPERLAVIDPHREWTYGDLARRSHQLAHHLRRGGVGRGDVVAIYAAREATLAWALLGVLETGAAFLILDPAYPVPRLAEQLRLAGPRGFLEIAEAPEELRAVAAETSRCRLELLSKATPELLDELPDEAPGIEINPDDLAYVAFTSGSTGRPKGIRGRHGSLTHFLPWLAANFELDSNDRHTLLSALAHDPLHRDVIMPLCLGATVCVPVPEVITTPGALAEWTRDQGITVLNAVPTLLRVLTHAPAGRQSPTLPALRRVFLVGEVLQRADVDRLYAMAPRAVCVNYYGTTETQRAVAHHVVPRRSSTAPAREVLPLGRGIADVQLLVRNPAGGLAGIGELGEICFRSPHLALGYLDDEQTRERFIANAFTPSSDPADRLYLTGDLGRYLPGGEVEFCGRADQQVQIRGFRIELGEIEATLARHPAVRESAVDLRPGPGGGPRLVAWVSFEPTFDPPDDPLLVEAQSSGRRVARGRSATQPGAKRRARQRLSTARSATRRPDGVEVHARNLRAWLAERLPDYMVPSAILELGALPTTRTGKMDRRALPDPPAPTDAAAATAPRNPAEKAVVQAFAHWLELEAVGVEDDFFALGGHSLLGTQVLAELQESFGLELPLRLLFEHPTATGLARAIVEREAAASAGDDLAELLDDLENLSEDELDALLADSPQEDLSHG